MRISNENTMEAEVPLRDMTELFEHNSKNFT